VGNRCSSDFVLVFGVSRVGARGIARIGLNATATAIVPHPIRDRIASAWSGLNPARGNSAIHGARGCSGNRGAGVRGRFIGAGLLGGI
jgi:hypothetical protein